MSDETFGTPQETTPVVPQPNSAEQLLASILNENGEQKYKSVEDAIKALDASQRYIPELKNQLSGYQNKVTELETKVSQFGNIEETVQRLLAQKPEGEQTPATPAVVDEQAVLRTVQQVLDQRAAAETAESNFKLVNSKLVETYGDKTAAAVAAKAAEHGTTPEALVALAKTSPAIVLALFQTPANNTPSSSRGGGITPPPIKPAVEAKRPEGRSLITGISDKERGSYFHDLRKEIYGKHGHDIQ